MKYVLAAVFVLCLGSTAFSQTSNVDESCDCSVIQGQCRAQVFREGNQIVIRSNNQMCARVTWFADENPFSTIVLNGRGEEEWLGQADDPFLSVSDCEVCATSIDAPDEAPAEQPVASDNSEPLPIIQVSCPRALDQITGSATFSFTVTDEGEVANIELIGTTQPLIVEKATAALARWRYEPATVGGVPVASEIQATIDCEDLPPLRSE